MGTGVQPFTGDAPAGRFAGVCRKNAECKMQNAKLVFRFPFSVFCFFTTFVQTLQINPIMKRIFIGLAMAIAVFSCTNDSTADNSAGASSTENEIDSVYASITTTKDVSEPNKTLQKVWSLYDSIRVASTNINKGYIFESEITRKAGTFLNSSNYDALKYTFDNTYYALAHGEFKVDSQIGLCCYSAEGTTTQKYQDSGECDNLLFATSKDGGNFTFSPVLGYLRVPIMGNNIVKSIELINNEDTYISGRYYCAATNPKQLFWDRDGERKMNIVLDCGEGVQLMDTPTDFYFAVKPMVFNKGVIVNITFADGSVFSHSYNKKIEAKRNEAISIGRFSTASGTTQSAVIKFSGTTLWVPTMSGSMALSGYINLGDGESKPLNSIERYNYTDGKATHDITLFVRHADEIKMSNLEGVTELDLSNF